MMRSSNLGTPPRSPSQTQSTPSFLLVFENTPPYMNLWIEETFHQFVCAKKFSLFGTPRKQGGNGRVHVYIYLDQGSQTIQRTGSEPSWPEVSNAIEPVLTGFLWTHQRSSKSKNITGTAGSLLVLSQEHY